MSKNVYPSKFTDKKIGAPQFLVDFIMERIAAKEKVTLPYKYWNSERWKKTFLAQLAHANALLKEHDCIAILEFLRSYRGKNIFSLGLKSQILAGCKAGQSSLPASETVVMDDHEEYTELLDRDTKESTKRKANLWEKL